MSWNSFGRVLRFTTWGESHGPALGAVVDGCPPGLVLTEADIQPWLDARRPGQNKFTTQRQGGGSGPHPFGLFRRQDHRHPDQPDDRKH